MNHLLESYGVDTGAPHPDDDLVSLLAERGLAVVDQINPEMLLPLATSIGVVVPHRDSGPDGVTTLADLGADIAIRRGFGGFSSRGLDPHTDRAGSARPPELLLMVCGQAAVSGGECLLVDGQAVHEDLAACAPDALQALSAPRCALFGGATGHLGSVFTTSTCGTRVAVRLRLDELARFNPTATRSLPALRAAIDRHTTVLKLDRGQGYVLNNHRWLHGRHAFTGQRVMFRLHANPLPHLQIPAGFHLAAPANAA